MKTFKQIEAEWNNAVEKDAPTRDYFCEVYMDSILDVLRAADELMFCDDKELNAKTDNVVFRMKDLYFTEDLE